MTSKERLHSLVEELPEGELLAAERYLEYLRDIGSDPVLRALALAPADDEPETEEERAAVQEGRQALAKGEVVADEELASFLSPPI